MLSRPRAVALLVALLASRAAPARACAVCGVGDPTLTVAGTERPFAGRLRISGTLRLGGVRVGVPGVDEIVSTEQRFDLGAAYAPLPTLFLSLALPALHRDAVDVHRRRSSTLGLGDIELRAKYFAWQGRRGPYTHQFAIQGGLKLPTAPVQRDAEGKPFSANLQPGMGAVTPLAGAFYGFTRGPYSLFASATLYLPFAVRAGPHAGDSLRSSVSAQLQPLRSFALRFGLDTRLESSADQDGKPDPNTGGFAGYVSPEVVVSPVRDLVLQVGAHFPVLQAFRGYHREETILALGVIYDL
jgi:hypothetical protein